MTTTSLEVLDTPAEFDRLPTQDLSATACVVLDVLRATSSIVTALAHGAEAVLPVADIPEALVARANDPGLLLAGERHGLRILAAQSGSVDFDLGNSPREFTVERVSGCRIAITTTNGTRALHAARGAAAVLVGSLLNLDATAQAVRQLGLPRLVVIAAGTFEEAALEDVFAAGGLCDLLWKDHAPAAIADSAVIARDIWRHASGDCLGALRRSRNGQRLLQRPELAADVPFAARLNAVPWVVRRDPDGWVRARPGATRA